MDSASSGPEVSIKIDWVVPPADLAELVHTFYLAEVGSGEIDEPAPAYSAQLALIAEGAAEMQYSDGRGANLDGLLLKAPQLRAGRIRVSGPFKAFGASLTPLGWATLTGLAADTVHDCEVEPDRFAAPDLLRDIEAWSSGSNRSAAQTEDWLGFLETTLRGATHPINPRHRDFVHAVTAWLGSELTPALDDLYTSLPMSRRQVQRLCRQFFGASPTQVLMRHRAIRTAMLLSNPELPQSLRDEVTAAYFDQAHMIRDIRRFTGRTPADLALPSLAQEGLDPAGHGKTAEVLLDDHKSQ